MVRKAEFPYRDAELLYCGSEGIAFSEVIRGLLPTKPDLPSWEQLCGRVVLPTFLGRVAIWQLCKIWRLEPGDEILMPAYNCGTEVDPFIAYGCKVILYRVDEKARIDFEDITRRRTARTKVIYVIHYFGWPQNIRELLGWCRAENLRLVEDCALALFSSGPDGPLGLQGDAAIFSIGKFLPVPGGGLLALRGGVGVNMPILQSCPWNESFARTKLLLRNSFQRQLESIGLYTIIRRLKIQLSKKQAAHALPIDLPDMPDEYYFDHRFKDTTMSPLARHISCGTDADMVRHRRRENYLALQDGLAGLPAITPLFDQLPAGTCPMAFPAIAPDCLRVVRSLEAHGIYACPFWNGYHHSLKWDNFPEARYLKSNLLTLPVTQSLSKAHMMFILSFLKELIDHNSHYRSSNQPVGSIL